MSVHYGYTNAILGAQTAVGGAAHDYNLKPAQGSAWSWSGTDTWFVVDENDGATVFNGDINNERVSAQEQIGGTYPQTVTIDGTARQVIWDYTFTVSDGVNVWRVAVIDVDLNNDDDLNDAGEDGYYLVFPDGLPPANTVLSVGAIVENDDWTPHDGLGATVVCFAAGTLIDTPDGLRPVESLCAGDSVLTRDAGPQVLCWAGITTVEAKGDLAPVVIAPGAFGNTTELVVSPQHAILLDDWRSEMLFGQSEVLVRAIDLVGHPGVTRRPGGRISYCHILCDAHHLVRANGLWSESLYPGDMARQSLNPAARAEIVALFPDLAGFGPAARPCLKRHEAACMLAA